MQTFRSTLSYHCEAKLHERYYHLYLADKQQSAALIINCEDKNRKKAVAGLFAFLTTKGVSFTVIQQLIQFLRALNYSPFNEGQTPLASSTYSAKMLDSMKHVTFEAIQHEIQKADVFQLSIDEMTRSKRTLMSVTARFLDKMSAQICWVPVHVYRVHSSRSGAVLAQQLAEELESIEFPIHKIIAISTDNASNMTSPNVGLVFKFSQRFPYIQGLTCAAHGLNLAISGAAKETSLLKTFFDFISSTVTAFNASTKATNILEDTAQKLGDKHVALATYTETRWMSRWAQIKAVRKNYRSMSTYILHQSENNNNNNTNRRKFFLSKLFVRTLLFAHDCNETLNACMVGLLSANKNFSTFATLKQDLLKTMSAAVDETSSSNFDDNQSLPSFAFYSKMFLALFYKPENISDSLFLQLCNDCNLNNDRISLMRIAEQRSQSGHICMLSGAVFTKNIADLIEDGLLSGAFERIASMEETMKKYGSVLIIENDSDNARFKNMARSYLVKLQDKLTHYTKTFKVFQLFEIFQPNLLPVQHANYGIESLVTIGKWLGRGEAINTVNDNVHLVVDGDESSDLFEDREAENLETAESSAEEEELLQESNIQPLVLSKEYPSSATNISTNSLLLEWNLYKTSYVLTTRQMRDAAEVLHHVYEQRERLKNLALVAAAGLTLLDSTLQNERLHSEFRFIESELRNRLKVENTRTVLLSRHVFKFDVTNVEPFQNLVESMVCKSENSITSSSQQIAESVFVEDVASEDVGDELL